jgi:hypothetical protein
VTLIAGFNVRNRPLIIGDLMLSTDADHFSEPLSLPCKNVNSLLGPASKQRIAGLVQKVNILSDQLAIAWAGPFNQAVIAANALATVAQKPDLSRADVDHALDKVKPELSP